MSSTVDNVARANEVLRSAYERIRVEVGAGFGNDMLSGDKNSIVDRVICHRLLKKFEEPNRSQAKAKRQRCFEQWVAIEDELAGVNPAKFSSGTLSVLYRARALLAKWCEDFKPSTEVEFTPGETFVSNQGRVSLIRKLCDRSHWTVSYEAFDDFAKLVYNTAGLKKAARKLMNPLTAAQSRRLLAVSKTPFEAFKFRLELVCTLTRGSRLSSVYKNAKEDRCINIESLGNLLLQRQVAHGFRDILSLLGNDLDVGQLVHRNRISERVSTVDFSSASDRVAMLMVRFLFPSRVVRLLERYRSSMTYVGDVAYLPRKLSSMGCGFTFEVMTLMLLAIARVLDEDATVYGDDVIISNDAALTYVDVMQEIGMKVNTEKSFISAAFRESCGSFYLEDYGYITCFDTKWCESWNDVATTANKLRAILADYRGPRSSALWVILNDAHSQLIACAPALSRGPVVDDLACGYLQVDACMARVQRKDRKSKLLFARVKDVLYNYCHLTGYDQRKLSLAQVYVYKPLTGFVKRRHLKDQGATYVAALYSGMLPLDTIRGAGEWVQKLVVCHPDFGWRFYKGILDHQATVTCGTD